MKEPRAFLQQLRRSGVALWVEENKLRCQGSTSILTPGILQLLQEMKPELIRVIQEPPKPCISCTCLELDPPGQWCVQELPGNSEWEYQHSLIDSLADCPNGHWN